MNEWINHPMMKDMDPVKLELIKNAANRTRGKSGKALAPVMMALITGANKKGIRFTPEEMDLILSIIKEGKPKEEQAKIDQMVKMTLEGIEVAANITLKAGGAAAKSLAATLYAILTDKKKVKGKTHLNSLLKSGKELKVFAIRHEDLKIFCEEAKRYGVLYSVLKEKNNKDGICDVMVRAEDASKISRIVDKFELAKIDTKAIKEAILAQKDNPIKDIPVMSNEEHDKLVNELMNEVKNPTKARKTKSDSQSGPFSKSAVAKDERPSVKKQLADIKNEKAKTPKPKSKTRVKTPRKKAR